MDKFHLLQNIENKNNKPEKLNYPFNYTPHDWAIQAADELKYYLSFSDEIQHDFKQEQEYEGTVSGKMFGVLVCESLKGEIGFLAGFSGKLGDRTIYDYFVPPVFDILAPDGFFLAEVEAINRINAELRELETDEKLPQQKQFILNKIQAIEKEIENQRNVLKTSKEQRDRYRLTLQDSQQKELEELNRQSATEHIQFKRFKKEKNVEIEALRSQLQQLTNLIETKKEQRAQLSGQLQLKIFQEFRFLNAKGEEKDLDQLFTQTLGVFQPAGAGECAAPKLFQYAYKNNLKPLALAEFWWGQSPKSEIRKHGQFYTSCKGKCEPILSHMLEGLEVEENPMLVRLRQKSEEIKELTIIYEDDYLVLVNKPEGFLSVPGNLYTDSVLERLKTLYPDATGPLLLHRLDMSTSGILIAAKEKKVHQLLQQQFLDHSIVKRYDAILDGVLITDAGEINLPLRVDLNDRPRQVVCYEYGKDALTKYQKIKVLEDRFTHVHFWPVTGRTHQLRMHASYEKGLHLPILGDDLYGKPAQRLYLHAGYIDFYHPVLKCRMQFEIPSDFESALRKEKC